MTNIEKLLNELQNEKESQPSWEALRMQAMVYLTATLKDLVNSICLLADKIENSNTSGDNGSPS